LLAPPSSGPGLLHLLTGLFIPALTNELSILSSFSLCLAKLLYKYPPAVPRARFYIFTPTAVFDETSHRLQIAHTGLECFPDPLLQTQRRAAAQHFKLYLFLVGIDFKQSDIQELVRPLQRRDEPRR
jgi:hypothetical protein